MTLDRTTKRKMLQASGLMALLLAPNLWLHRNSLDLPLIVGVILLPVLFATLPLAVAWSRSRRQLRLEARARWREAYRTSPESDLLHLD